MIMFISLFAVQERRNASASWRRGSLFALEERLISDFQEIIVFVEASFSLSLYSLYTLLEKIFTILLESRERYFFFTCGFNASF